MPNVCPTPPPSEQSPITASCCAWCTSTGDNGYSQKALRSYTLSTVQPVKLVTPDRNVVADVLSVEVVRPETCVLAIPFRMQRLVVCPLVTDLQQEPQVTPFDDSPLPTYSNQDTTVTEQDKQVLAELCWASAMALPRCVVTRDASAWAASKEP